MEFTMFELLKFCVYLGVTVLVLGWLGEWLERSRKKEGGVFNRFEKYAKEAERQLKASFSRDHNTSKATK